jgi:hypothetical protein
LKLAKKKKMTAAKKVEMEEVDEVVEQEEHSKPATGFTDLHQVMDYTRPLTIFFSGVEYESYLDILYELGIRNFLMSYEYLKGKGAYVLKKYHDVHIFIDSGAYTYQNDPKYESYTIEQWEEQIVTYLKWAERHKDNIFAIADLDLQYLPNVGYEQVYEWRKKYFEPFMLRTGVPVCFIYHEDGLDYWDYMCKRYPYVGLSLAIDKVENGTEQLKEMFRTAEKHNALCQGMASTNTSMLTEYPFYTVDSTTWNVGLKYGEISVWDKTRMRRIKKEEFETKAFPVISQYDKKFDFDLIREEDKTEMIKVNAYAFVQAEKYVNERLKAKMYWFKKRAKKVDVYNLPPDFFPPVTWFTGSRDDYAVYAEKMNINPDCPEAKDFILDMTAFLNWNSRGYADLKQVYIENDYKVLNEVHDLHINRIVDSPEEKIQDLIKFYKECLSGENDRLLQYGTNFDRVLKERDAYIEDEPEYDEVDLTPEEVRVKLAQCLPAPEDGGTPEIDNLDEEIYREQHIVPTWGPDGKLLKGQTRVRKPKQVYSQKFPKFACDTCYAAQRCKEYKAGYVCAFQKMFQRFDTRDQSDIIASIQGIVNHNMVRMQRAMIMETMNGTIDPVVSQLMDTNMKYMQMLNQMYQQGNMEVLRQSRVVRADGTVEESMSVQNPQSSGIMEKLFSSLANSPKDDPEEVIEAEVIDVTPKKNERYMNLEEE